MTWIMRRIDGEMTPRATGREARRVVAVGIALAVAVGCASRGESPRAVRVPSADNDHRPAPQRVKRPDASSDAPPPLKGSDFMMRRLFLQSLTPVAMTLSLLVAAPVHALQQLDGQRADRPVARRRPADTRRHNTLGFVRTELFFGTAKPVGAVTEEEFRTFLDDMVTPLFPDGLTVTRADGQFRGADGITIKETSYVLILLYPVDGQKASSRNIDLIRAEYMRRHQQESVLRVDDPFLVWVSF